MKMKRYMTPIHGGITIDTRNNSVPTHIVGYEAQRIHRGGRVWRLHADGSRSWVVDTLLWETAKELAADKKA